DIGPALTADLRRVGGLIFAGLPVIGSDTGDYLVRNLLAIDPGRGALVLGAEVAAGDPILFCRRDPESARRDMNRMVRQLAGRLSGPPKAGVYVSCVARGAGRVGDAGGETGLIREALGEFPLIGCFANGEISRDRLYGDTGVLTLCTCIFGGGDKPRSLWVGVERSPELVALRDKVEQALIRVGLAPEPRKFSPHVTLARLHNPALDEVSGFLAAHARFRADPLPVEGFSLIASLQTKAGPVYEDQADYPLLH